NNTKLNEIYEEINKLEKTDIEEFKYTSYEEQFRPWAIFGLCLLGFELLLRYTVFRSFV
ncbi:MAG: Ca-activated chloride channel family protein, partial [Patiriisocius sp.]